MIENANVELNKKISEFEQLVALKDEQYKSQARELEQSQSSTTKLSELIKVQEESYEKALKDSKPSVFKVISNDIVFVLIGIGIGALAL